MQEDLLKLFHRYVEIVGTRKAYATMMRAIGDHVSEGQNPLLPWMAERCVVAPGQQVDCGIARRDFIQWYGKEISKRSFGEYLQDTGHVRRVSARGVPSGSVYRGISIVCKSDSDINHVNE